MLLSFVKDDYDRVFRRLVRTGLLMQKNGATVERMLQMATYSLAIGHPDNAFEWTRQAVQQADCTVEQSRQAVHLSVLALALKAGILEGDIEGTPRVMEAMLPVEVPVNKPVTPVELRRRAITILEAIEDRTSEETILLRKLRLGMTLGYVETLVSEKMKLPKNR